MMQKVSDDYQLKTGFYNERGAELRKVFEQVKPQLNLEKIQDLVSMDHDPELFDEFITVDTTLTVADMEQMSRFTFNLNPAMQEEALRQCFSKP